jgi:pimeloyl-ACP methyl ester carboxylesterase
MMGTSAGALSAMQFAIKYPDRISALVLQVPDSWAPRSHEARQRWRSPGANLF